MGTELQNIETEATPDHSALAKTIRATIKVVAWPLSAFTSYLATASIIRNDIYKNLAQTGIFESSKKKIKTEPLRKLLEDSKTVPNPEIPALMKEINENYRQNVRSLLRHAGFRTVGDYWKGLNHNQRVQSGVFGITVGGIMLGAMLEIANNKGLLERMTHVEKNLKKDEPDIAP